MSTLTKPKLLIAILACHHRAPHLRAIRETWVPDIKDRCEYRFFFGRGSHANPQADEVTLDCDDAYRGLACKVQEACRWALHHGFEILFKVDDDTYVRPDRVVMAGFEKHDWVGRVNAATDMYHLHPYTRGGVGYSLSRRAMQALVSAPKPNPDIPSEYAEDSWVGKIMLANGIVAVNDDRLRCAELSGPGRRPRPQGFEAWKKDAPSQGNNFITTCEFLGSEMYPVHKYWQESRQQHTTLMSKLRVK
jgi:hypothetical protein